MSPIPSISDGLPYQHADFSTPQPRGLTGLYRKLVEI